MQFNLKFKPVPEGTDAVYCFIPGQLEVFFFRQDWVNANYILAAAITYLGRQGAERKRASGGQEEIWIGCQLADFIFEPFPGMTISDPPPPPGEGEDDGEGESEGGKIIYLDPLLRRRRTGSGNKAH